MDDSRYVNRQKIEEADFESLCKRCGTCCGRDDEPCSNLAADEKGNYYCRSYENRFGPQITIGGCKFNCVSIREVLKFSLPCPGCGYAAIYDSGRCL